jgi:hypothetical protein
MKAHRHPIDEPCLRWLCPAWDPHEVRCACGRPILAGTEDNAEPKCVECYRIPCMRKGCDEAADLRCTFQALGVNVYHCVLHVPRLERTAGRP